MIGDRFELKRDPDNGYFIGPDGCHHETEAEAMYVGVLGFCCCGNPEEAHEFAIKCLGAFDRDKAGWTGKVGVDAIVELVKEDPETAALFIAYALDKANLMEHGGGIYGSWLTALGKQFIEIGPMKDEEEA